MLRVFKHEVEQTAKETALPELIPAFMKKQNQQRQTQKPFLTNLVHSTFVDGIIKFHMTPDQQSIFSTLTEKFHAINHIKIDF